MGKLNNGETLYGFKWQRRRAIWLQSHPLCAYCEKAGQVTAAEVVDHKTPHRGDAALFWDEDNWQSLCKSHHDSAKQREEKRGHSTAVGLDGWPVDDRHPVNATRDTGRRTKQGGGI